MCARDPAGDAEGGSMCSRRHAPGTNFPTVGEYGRSSADEVRWLSDLPLSRGSGRSLDADQPRDSGGGVDHLHAQAPHALRGFRLDAADVHALAIAAQSRWFQDVKAAESDLGGVLPPRRLRAAGPAQLLGAHGPSAGRGRKVHLGAINSAFRPGEDQLGRLHL